MGLAVLIALLAVFATQQGGGDGGGGPLNAIAEAAVKTQEEGGARAAMRGTVTEGGSKPLAVRGQIVYNASGMSRGTVTMPNPDSGKTVKLEMVEDGSEVYMRSSAFKSLPEGKDWMGLDFAFGDEVDTSVPPGGDARGKLEMLEEVTGGVDQVGRAVVRGVATKRYRGRIGVTHLAERLREEGAETAASLVERHGIPIEVEAWIDAEGLVRRMRIVQSRPGEAGAGSTTTDVQMDFFAFGIEPEIEVPDSDEVFDATSATQEQLEAPGDE